MYIISDVSWWCLAFVVHSMFEYCPLIMTGVVLYIFDELYMMMHCGIPMPRITFNTSAARFMLKIVGLRQFLVPLLCHFILIAFPTLTESITSSIESSSHVTHVLLVCLF